MDIKKIEEEFDKNFHWVESTDFLNLPDSEENQIKSFYRQAIKELLEEVVGEDTPVSRHDREDTLMTMGENKLKAEQRQKIKEILGE